MSESLDEQITKLNVEVRILEQTAEVIQNRINMLSAMIADLTNAKMSLEGLENTEENTEILVPIGGNSYIKSKLAKQETVILGVGAGISLEKKPDEAKIMIKNRLEDLKKARTSLQQQLAEVIGKLNEDKSKFEKLVSKLRQEKTSENV